MKKQEAASELIQSIDRVIEIEAEYGFEYVFVMDWDEHCRKHFIHDKKQPYVISP